MKSWLKKSVLFSAPIHAGMLSFLLPGLGQVFQRRFLMAIPFFISFIFLLSNPPLRLWILAPIVISAWDAQRVSISKAVWDFKTVSYFVVGAIAFFSAFSLLVEKVLPTPELGKISYTADFLSEQVKSCAEKQRAMPFTLESCTEAMAAWKKDPWGNPYRFLASEQGYEIRTLGRDGIQSEDDFVFRYPLPAFLRDPRTGGRP